MDSGSGSRQRCYGRSRTERPQILRIRTGNADSNGAMLAINHRLGFKLYIAETVWQLGVDRVERFLAGEQGS